MAADLIMSEEAEQDVAYGYAYYERQRVGFGEDFLARVDACIAGILRAPKVHAIFYRDFRRSLVRRFPYAGYYTYDEADNQVAVYCVFHTSRDPDKLRERLS
jgi:plasmid stabilization system protein ParE